ncbi:MAG: glycosyltransferase family 2 protein [Terracidiphilus sp.]
MIISIITATYNRSGVLRNLFKSLVDQNYDDIEWIIVDDGGTDNTGQIVAEFERKANFGIGYLRTENQGKSAAVNVALDLVAGDMVAIIDDDDYFLPGVFHKVAADYTSIADDDTTAGLSYLTVDPEGRTWGKKFPMDRMISDHYKCRVNEHVWGDKCEFTKSKVLRENDIRYATGGMRFGFGGETVFFFKVADRGNTLYINMPVLVKEYRVDGLSVNWRRNSLENPQLSAEYYAAHLSPKIRPWIRLRYMVAYVAIMRFAGRPIEDHALAAPWNWVLFCLAYIPGAWTGIRWKRYKKKGYPISKHWLHAGKMTS